MSTNSETQRDFEERVVRVRKEYRKGEIDLPQVAVLLGVDERAAQKLMAAKVSLSDETLLRFLRMRRSAQEHALELFTLFSSFFALIVSSYAIYANRSLENQVATERSITNSYSTFYDLDHIALEHPRVSHLFAGPTYYDDVERDVKVASARSTPQELALLRLEERQAASLVFDYFEETVYQYDQARRTESAQLPVLEKNLQYLTHIALRNPRLLWYWSPTGGKLNSDYDPLTIQYFESRVLKNKTITPVDSAGPFCVGTKFLDAAPSTKMNAYARANT